MTDPLIERMIRAERYADRGNVAIDAERDAIVARLSAVLAAARAIIAARSDGAAYVPDLAEALRAADGAR